MSMLLVHASQAAAELSTDYDIQIHSLESSTTKKFSMELNSYSFDVLLFVIRITGAALPPQVIPPADANAYGRHTPWLAN